jgi:hypothetical protein
VTLAQVAAEKQAPRPHAALKLVASYEKLDAAAQDSEKTDAPRSDGRVGGSDLHMSGQRGEKRATSTFCASRSSPLPKRSYVYEIKVDGVRRYIGKGSNGRVYHHMKEVRQRLRRQFKLKNVSPIFQRKLTEAVMKGAVVQEVVLADNLTSKNAHELEYHQLKRMVDNGKRHDLWNVIPQSIYTPQEYDAYLKKLTENATSKDRLTRALARMQLMRLGKDARPTASTSRLARRD